MLNFEWYVYLAFGLILILGVSAAIYDYFKKPYVKDAQEAIDNLQRIFDEQVAINPNFTQTPAGVKALEVLGWHLGAKQDHRRQELIRSILKFLVLAIFAAAFLYSVNAVTSLAFKFPIQ